MTVKDIIETNGHIYVCNLDLFKKNVDLLKNFGIDLKKCNSGVGVKALGYTDLEQKLEIIKEMGYDDEVLKNPENALNVIVCYFMTLDYNASKDFRMQYVKGVA